MYAWEPLLASEIDSALTDALVSSQSVYLLCDRCAIDIFKHNIHPFQSQDW